MSITVRKLSLCLAPFLLVLATGFTSCDYFDNVTVPASDRRAPDTYDGVYRGSEYVILSQSNQSFDYTLAPGVTVMAVSSAIDSGGLKKLTMSTSSASTCCNGDLCRQVQGLTAPKIEEQRGTVGSTVSNGIWLYSSVKVPTCPDGMTLEWFSFSWRTVAEDFHGNRTTGEWQSISYP
ncbi:MAG TPA: hypothetical protein VM734_02845 [Kofleriaceae bacterium]|jgi:hypothetical protein|nr:hypothetical protein [Kofleriaceae bacterium]